MKQFYADLYIVQVNNIWDIRNRKIGKGLQSLYTLSPFSNILSKSCDFQYDTFLIEDQIKDSKELQTH